jgi:hypothetical protein
MRSVVKIKSEVAIAPKHQAMGGIAGKAPNIALMMEAVSTLETSVNFYDTTRRSIPEGCHLRALLILAVDRSELSDSGSGRFTLGKDFPVLIS